MKLSSLGQTASVVQHHMPHVLHKGGSIEILPRNEKLLRSS
jgi:hypothetical protein